MGKNATFHIHVKVNMSTLPSTQNRSTEDIVNNLEINICQSSLHTSSALNITDLVKQYNTVLGELADKHVPIITQTVTVRPCAPWYTDEIASAKYLRRMLEHKWLHSKLTTWHTNNSASKLTACHWNPNMSIKTVRLIRFLGIKRN